MKTAILRIQGQAAASALLAAVFATTTLPGLRAQTSAPAASQTSDSTAVKLSDSDLDDLLGPIALYPDALIGIILPASTVPSDVTLAARFLAQNGDDANVDGQPWDQSVIALAKYPDVLKWMDDNLEWTNSLGEAFVEQPADVMNAVQRLRGEAQAKGNLVNTPQQTVVVEKNTETIRIVPTDPQVIYVPQYDPEIVYVDSYQPDYGPVLAFGAGFAVGSWLSYDFDWGNHGFYHGRGIGWNNHDRWYGDRGNRDGSVNVNTSNTNITNISNVTTNNTVNRWQPSANSRRTFNERQRKNLGNSRIARADHKNAASPALKNGKPVKARNSAVPKPGKINAGRNNGKNNANAANRPNNRPATGPNKPGNGPNDNKPNKGQNAGNNKPENRPATKPGQVNRPKAPTKAPSVNGERPNNGKKPNGSNANNRPNNDGPKKPNSNAPSTKSKGENSSSSKPKKQPSSAPSANKGSSRPKAKPSQPENRAPSKPKSESRPQAKAPSQPKAQSRPQPKQEQRSQPKQQQRPQQKPQASRPQPQKSQPQQNKQQQSGGNNKKSNNKKDKKDNN